MTHGLTLPDGCLEELEQRARAAELETLVAEWQTPNAGQECSAAATRCAASLVAEVRRLRRVMSLVQPYLERAGVWDALQQKLRLEATSVHPRIASLGAHERRPHA